MAIGEENVAPLLVSSGRSSDREPSSARSAPTAPAAYKEFDRLIRLQAAAGRGRPAVRCGCQGCGRPSLIALATSPWKRNNESDYKTHAPAPASFCITMENRLLIRLKRSLVAGLAAISCWLTGHLCASGEEFQPGQRPPELRDSTSTKPGEQYSYVNSLGLKSISPRFRFDGTISREVLENYLARSITMEGLLNGRGDLKDNLRMLKSIGAKYIGRALCLWGAEADFQNNLKRAAEAVPQVLAADPEMVLEACVFETVSARVNQIEIPDWVFIALGQPVAQRHFRFEEMIYPEGQRRPMGRNAQVPDESKLETRLWFYYQAASYIDLGCEAIHFGQVEIMNRNDRDNSHWADLLTGSENMRRAAPAVTWSCAMVTFQPGGSCTMATHFWISMSSRCGSKSFRISRRKPN